MLFEANIENLETLKYHTFSKKTLVLSIICSKYGSSSVKVNNLD